MATTPKDNALTFPGSASTDTPEVAAFKADLWKAVNEAASEQGFTTDGLRHSPILRTAFAKLGLKPEAKAKIKVVTTHPFEFVVNVLPSALSGKTEVEQKAILAAEIGPLTLTSSNFGNAKVTVPPEAIVTMEVLPEPEEPEDDGLLWYRHDFARVQHAYNSDALENGGTDPLCGNGEMYLGHLPSEQKRISKAAVSTAHCKKCEAAAAKR